MFTVKDIVLKGLQANDVYLHITYRDDPYETKSVKTSEGEATFPYHEWPLETELTDLDKLSVRLYRKHNVFSDRLLGELAVSLESINVLKVKSFTGVNFYNQEKTKLKVVADFTVEYSPPKDKPMSFPLKAVPSFSRKTPSYQNVQEHHGTPKPLSYADETDGIPLFSSVRVNLPEPEVDTKTDWKVIVFVHEAKNLTEHDILPVVEVKICNQKKSTQEAELLSNVFTWNEPLEFTFHQRKSKLLDFVFELKVTSGSVMKDELGCADFDLWTVYNEKNHTLYKKWAVLQEYNSPKINGYILLNVTVCPAEEFVPTPRVENDNFDLNLLLPNDFQAPRELYNYSVTVYQAEGVASPHSGGLTTITKAITGKHSVTLPDPYVEVTFAGEKKSTAYIKKTTDPVFNQTLHFKGFFPPMFHRLKLQLRDKETLDDECLATTFLDLSQLSYYGDEDLHDLDFRPNIGPCWIPFYGSPTVFNSHVVMNKGYAKGVTFRGRVLVELTCEKLDTELANGESSSNPCLGKRDSFLLYGTFFEAGMLEKKLMGRNISFEVSIGSCGLPEQSNKVGEPGDLETIHGMWSTERVLERTPPVKAASLQVDFGSAKPCVYGEFTMEDTTYRLYVSGMLKKMYLSLEDNLAVITKSLKKKLCQSVVKDTLSVFSEQVGKLIKNYEDLKKKYSFNELDHHLFKKRKHVLRHLLSDSKKILHGNGGEILEYFTKLKSTVHELVSDPQNSFPDVIIWMIAKEKRVAYTRVSVTDIIYSEDDFQCGMNAGILHSEFMTLPKFDKKDRYSRYIQAKIDVRLWFGLSSAQDKLLINMPSGYKISEVTSSPYPAAVVYEKLRSYDLRAHMYQGRTVLGSDDNALSDPFARVLFGNSTETTRVIDETRTPLWDQTFTFKNVILYGDDMKKHPPVVLIAVFDKDPEEKEEFLGQTIAIPEYIPGDYHPAKLTWRPLVIGRKHAGEILASFELFPVDRGPLPPLPASEMRGNDLCFPVPVPIRPKLVTYRMEILFWGVRDMHKSNDVFPVSILKPQIVADLSYEMTFQDGSKSKKLKTRVCQNALKNPNFESPVHICDVDLPEHLDFLPTFNFRVYDIRRFSKMGGKFFATHVSEPLNHFMCDAKKYKNYFNCLSLGSEVDGDKTDGGNQPQKDVILHFEEDDEEDWWSRFYTSELDAMEPHRMQSSTERSIPRITIYENELEKVTGFSGFNDFLTTFALVRGKQDKYENEMDNRRVKGKVKGCIRLWRKNQLTGMESLLNNRLGTFQSLPSNKPIKVLVRVYCVAAKNLTAKDARSKKADPYTVVLFGENKHGNRSDHRSNTLNPEFGIVHEVEGCLPFDSTLTVQVFDWDVGISDDLIGETNIDIENRFFSKHRARCGLAKQYFESGSSMWRDLMKPSEILESQRVKDNITPLYNSRQHRFFYIESSYPTLQTQQSIDTTDNRKDGESRALETLNAYDKLPGGYKLVPEHVETRYLTHPEHRTVSQGQLLMWVDIFPCNARIPPPVNITRRKPKEYELRVIVWNCEKVPLIEKSLLLGAKSSDVLVKGWMEGLSSDAQKTDVHYRSTDGVAMFNWRMKFPFKFLQAKKKMVCCKKLSILSLEETEFYYRPVLVLECREADIFSSRLFGTLTIPLLNLPPLYGKASGWSLTDWQDEMKKKKPVSLFQCRSMRGWMPFSPSDGSEKEKGRVDVEIELVKKEEADARPVGLRREAPQALDKPNRPEESLKLFIAPFKLVKILWNNYKWALLKLFLVILVILILALFIYSYPGYLAKKSLSV